MNEMTHYLETLVKKRPDETLTVEELACALYEGTPHLANLAEKLARQHSQAEALTFFDLMGEDVQAFWMHIAQELIEHSSQYRKNDGCACVLRDEEHQRLHHLRLGDEHERGDAR